MGMVAYQHISSCMPLNGYHQSMSSWLYTVFGDGDKCRIDSLTLWLYSNTWLRSHLGLSSMMWRHTATANNDIEQSYL